VAAGSVLCDDLLAYFHNRALLKEAEDDLAKLEQLNADYDALLSQLAEDPNALKRIAPVTLGVEPNDPCAAYPHATVDKLAAARHALMEEPDTHRAEEAAPWPQGPEMLLRCCEQPRKTILFIFGGSLVVVSFVFFGPAKPQPRQSSTTDDQER